MRLPDWIEQQGRGALSRLSEESGVCYPTVHSIFSGKQTPTYATAKRISDATFGEVSIAELCEPPPKRSRNARPRVNRPRTAARKRRRTKARAA